MNINIKILSVDSTTGTAVVRFFTDIITESDLVTQADEVTGEILRCSTDFNCWIPREPLVGQNLIEYFKQFAPIEMFDRMEKARTGAGVDVSEAQALLGQVTQPSISTKTVTLAQTKADKKATAKMIRQVKENGTVLVGTVAVATDPDSQAKINGALTAMQNGFLQTVNWKGENGWVTLDLDTVTQVARIVATYIQSCFTWEKAACEQIDAATTIDEVNSINLNNFTVI